MSTAEDLDNLKNILKKGETDPNRSNFKRSKTINAMDKVTMDRLGLWDELENVYKDMQEREKDLQTAVEIGKMLLDKNNDLKTQTERHEQQIEQIQLELKERENEVAQLTKQLEIAKQSIPTTQMRTSMDSLQMRVELLKVGKEESEMKNLVMNEELSKMESEVERYRKQFQILKQKNQEFAEEQKARVQETEQIKVELEQFKATERNLRKKIKSNNYSRGTSLKKSAEGRDISVEQLEKEKLEEELAALEIKRSKMDEIIEDLREENWNLHVAQKEKEDERVLLLQKLETLTKQNDQLQRQQQDMVQERERMQSQIAILQQKPAEPVKPQPLEATVDDIDIHEKGVGCTEKFKQMFHRCLPGRFR